MLHTAFRMHDDLQYRPYRPKRSQSALAFWLECIRAAAHGSAPFANDWQWVFGNPTVAGVLPALGAGLLAWIAEHQILGSFIVAFAAYVVTWICALAIRTLGAAPALYYSEKERANVLAERLTPRMQITFDPHDEGCVHIIPETERLNTGKRGMIIRVLPKCLTDAPIPDCRGFLNGVYWRASDADHWQLTALRDQLSLKWSTLNIGAAIQFRKGFLQYLDIGAIDEDGNVLLFAHDQQERGRLVFKKPGLYRLDIVITGSGHEADIANLSLQLKQTDQWNEPNIKVLG